MSLNIFNNVEISDGSYVRLDYAQNAPRFTGISDSLVVYNKLKFQKEESSPSITEAGMQVNPTLEIGNSNNKIVVSNNNTTIRNLDVDYINGRFIRYPYTNRENIANWIDPTENSVGAMTCQFNGVRELTAAITKPENSNSSRLIYLQSVPNGLTAANKISVDGFNGVYDIEEVNGNSIVLQTGLTPSPISGSFSFYEINTPTEMEIHGSNIDYQRITQGAVISITDEINTTYYSISSVQSASSSYVMLDLSSSHPIRSSSTFTIDLVSPGSGIGVDLNTPFYSGFVADDNNKITIGNFSQINPNSYSLINKVDANVGFANAEDEIILGNINNGTDHFLELKTSDYTSQTYETNIVYVAPLSIPDQTPRYAMKIKIDNEDYYISLFPQP